MRAELRQAAETLREKANAATPPPWRAEFNTHGDPFVVPALSHAPLMHRIADVSTSGSDYGRADAVFMGTMHPGVALALADWLTAEADLSVEFDRLLAEYSAQGFAVTEERSSFDQAVAVARAILGETP